MEVKKWFAMQSNAATSVFHIESYCKPWKTSLFSLGKPSFHIVLDGFCWLQIDNKKKREKLNSNDIVFFFSNIPFYITSSESTPIEKLPEREMNTFKEVAEETTSLICGFLMARSRCVELLFALMPEFIIINTHSPVHRRFKALLELLRIEYIDEDETCEIKICRLTDLLLIYLLDEANTKKPLDINLLKLAENPRILELALEILASPQKCWSNDSMAKFVHMSRSTFIRKTEELSGYTPNEILTRLRINVAQKLMQRGLPAERVSADVGYHSAVGFYKAFRRTTGSPPGKWLTTLS